MIKQINLNYGCIFLEQNRYILSWGRGKENFNFDINEELMKKAQLSQKDELEVMFYCENKRWPKEGELDHYNETKVKTYIGNHITIYEEDGKFEISWELNGGEIVYYPITEEQKDMALGSDKGRRDVMYYVEHGEYPNEEKNERRIKTIF